MRSPEPAATASSGLAPRLALLGAAALFSTGGAVIKAISLTGWQVSCCRSAVAAATLALLLPAARRRPGWRSLLLACVYAATMVLYVLANKLTTAASTIFLQGTAPLYVLLLGPWLLGEHVRRRDLPYMVALGLGLALLCLGRDAASATAPAPLLGDGLALLSGVAWALTLMGLRALGRRPEEAEVRPPTSDPSPPPALSPAPSGAPAPPKEREGEAATLLWGNLLASAACLPMALPLPAARPRDWALVVFLGVVQISFAYILLARGVARVAALDASLLLLLEPVLNPIWAWLVHGERPGPGALAGGTLILAATLLKSWRDSRQPRPPRDTLAISTPP